MHYRPKLLRTGKMRCCTSNFWRVKSGWEGAKIVPLGNVIPRWTCWTAPLGHTPTPLVENFWIAAACRAVHFFSLFSTIRAKAWNWWRTFCLLYLEHMEPELADTELRANSFLPLCLSLSIWAQSVSDSNTTSETELSMLLKRDFLDNGDWQWIVVLVVTIQSD